MADKQHTNTVLLVVLILLLVIGGGIAWQEHQKALKLEEQRHEQNLKWQRLQAIRTGRDTRPLRIFGERE